MKILILTLFLGLTVLNAKPVITSDKKYDPPSDWTINKEFEKESWWRAFYSQVRPEDFKFDEYKKFYPEKVLKDANISEEKYAEIIAEEIKNRKELKPETKIARVIYVSDSGADYVFIIEDVMTSHDHKSSDTHAFHVFKKIQDTWVSEVFPEPADKYPVLKFIMDTDR